MSNGIIERIHFIFTYQFAKVGEASITLWTLLQLAIFMTAIFYIASKTRTVLVNRVLARTRLDLGTRQAIGTMFRYAILIVGTLVGLQSVGINLTTLNVIAGAVGIGVGFGLQNIASNFISGLIILLERPIKVGDRVVIGDTEGDVMEIGARSTTLVTNNNIAVIVPNSRFVSESVINWKYTDNLVRFEIPVTVESDADPRTVERLLLDIAAANPDVLNSPPPDVCFNEFTDRGMKFLLRVWNQNHLHKKLVLLSALNFAIHERFAGAGIEIAIPKKNPPRVQPTPNELASVS
jgi:small-conductance mechanosensitive channel